MLNIDEIRLRVKELGIIINAPDLLLCVQEKPVGDGTPHIEFENGKYYYVISERGSEFSREKISCDDEILYKILKNVVTRMALDFELNNRVKGKDFRRIYFSKEIEIMNKLNSEWGKKIECEIEETLRNSPYSDEEIKPQSCLEKIKNKLFGK